MQVRKITAHCKKPFIKNIQIYPDRADFFREKGYKENDLCLAKKIIDTESCYYIVSIHWHQFVLTEEQFFIHFTSLYEEGVLNACAVHGHLCQHLRAFIGHPGETTNRRDHWCQKNQDVGRGVCAFYDSTGE